MSQEHVEKAKNSKSVRRTLTKCKINEVKRHELKKELLNSGKAVIKWRNKMDCRKDFNVYKILKFSYLHIYTFSESDYKTAF